MTIRNELLDELLKDYRKPEDILGESGLLKQLTKAILDRCLQGGMTHHLGYAKHEPKGKNSGNSRNGSYDETVIGEQGETAVTIPETGRGALSHRYCPRGQVDSMGLTTRSYRCMPVE